MRLKGMTIETTRRITRAEIIKAAARASEDYSNINELWKLAQSGDRQTSINALWILTYMCGSEKEWFSSLQNEMIDRLLIETDVSKKRMLLQILRSGEYTVDSLRTDFIDFCLSKINAECEPYAVRAYCIHIAFKMCRFYPELLSELEGRLEMMSFQSLSPGLSSARKATLRAIGRIRK